MFQDLERFDSAHRPGPGGGQKGEPMIDGIAFVIMGVWFLLIGTVSECSELTTARLPSGNTASSASQRSSLASSFAWTA